jgi:hypothetical protein
VTFPFIHIFMSQTLGLVLYCLFNKIRDKGSEGGGREKWGCQGREGVRGRGEK